MNKLFLYALVGGAAGFFLARRRRATSKAAPARDYDRQFAGGFPRYSGAISAVTGGPPEDMNAMPATPSTEGPIWDGSQLDQGRTAKVHSRFPQ